MDNGSTESSRPTKRFKSYRRRRATEEDVRPGSAEDQQDAHDSPNDINPLLRDDEDRGSLSIADILRHRRDSQRKKGGVEFSREVPTSSTLDFSTSSSAIADVGAPDEQAISLRFAPQTGHITEETDKHMYDHSFSSFVSVKQAATDIIRMAYVDREYAHRSASTQNKPNVSSNVGSHDAIRRISTPEAPTRNPASLGKLHEIDLGPSAKLQNIARTEAAITGSPSSPPPPKKAPKVRIGRNGKPYIPKPRPDRKRRNSADIARDKVVETILSETKLEVYDEPLSDNTAGATGDQGSVDQEAADDRLAEQFRRDFIDAMNQRKEKANKMPGYGAAGTKAGDEKAKGPKLGGSRSARAAMKEKQDAADRAAAAARGRR